MRSYFLNKLESAEAERQQKKSVEPTIQQENEQQGDKESEAIEAATAAIEGRAAATRDSEHAIELLEQIAQQKERVAKTIKKIDSEQSLKKEYPTESIVHEIPSVEVAKQVKADLTRYVKAVAKIAGLNFNTDRKGKQEICRVNLAPAGGEAYFTLWSMKNPELGVEVRLEIDASYTTHYDSYIIAPLFGIRTLGGFAWPNVYYTDMTAKELAKLIVDKLNIEVEYDIKQKEKAKQNATFEDETASDVQPLETVEQSEVVDNSNDHDTSTQNRNNSRGVSGRVRSDMGRVDDGVLPAGADEANGEQPAQTDANEYSNESHQPRELSDRPAEHKPVRSRSDKHGSATDRPNGASHRTQRRTADGGAGSDAGEALGDNTPLNHHSYVIEDASNIAPKGEITKIRANIAAIKLLKQLEAEAREATPEEKKILSQYSGWGGVAEVLNKFRKWEYSWKEKYLDLHNQLVELLTPAEYEYAVNSTINAHYTSGTVATELWKIAERLGFSGGTVLEPAVGTGNFFGLIPKPLAEKSQLRAYELDSLTGRIAAHLYSDAYVKGNRLRKFNRQEY